MSSVKRVARSNVRFHARGITCEFPSLTMYSAAIRSSSIDDAGPRFESTGFCARPTSERSVKFCMFQAPIWMTSAASTTASTCRASMSSVTIELVSSRAATRMSRPLPEPGTHTATSAA